MTESRANEIQVLLVDDDGYILDSAGQTLELEGYSVVTCDRAEKALGIISSGWSGIVVTDINMPGMTGLELQAKVKAIDSDIPVIIITGHGDISMAVTAIRDGAYDFIEKPFAS